MQQDSTADLVLPDSGVTIRMYRIGHGDCFLLAFPRSGGGKPVFMLIDCGYKPGSPKFIRTTAKEVTDDIRRVTGGRIDVMVVTHEHQDHVNGITESNFNGIRIGETWFAWTEDPDDEDANALRKRFKDRLQFLIQARNRLAAGVDHTEQVNRIDDFLAFEIGGESESFDPSAAAAALGATGGASLSLNKRAMALVRDRCEKVRYLNPHKEALAIPGVENVRVFPLGPPRDPELLHSLDPVGEEGFAEGSGFALGTSGGFFAAAVSAPSAAQELSPFSKRFRVDWNAALSTSGGFQATHYGGAPDSPVACGLTESQVDLEASSNSAWRRINSDWLLPTGSLALDMNNDTNNGSLVLAIELSPGGKVLLFAADAQRGNWISWTRGTWTDGARKVDARDLLSRAVLYKVGHHGSHNATLKGSEASDYANLSWIAEGAFSEEFTAMITAVRPWAETQKGWNHPLPAIKEELMHKALGRVFQTDTDVSDMVPTGSQADWDAFLERVQGESLYIDLRIDT